MDTRCLLLVMTSRVRRCCRQCGLRSLCWVKASLEQAHQECGTWTHWDINTTSLPTEGTQGLQGCLCCCLLAHLSHDMPGTGASLGAFCPWCRAFCKTSYNNCLKMGFLNKGWENQNKIPMKKIKKIPFSLPNQPCLANSEVILCFGSDSFFSKSNTLHRETSFTYAIKYCFPEQKWPHRACCQHIPARFLWEFSKIISFGTVAQ